MKNAIMLLLLLLSLFANAQINLEKTYDTAIYYVKLKVAGGKYYCFDRENKTIKLYNLDHSLFKTITIPAYEQYNLDGASSIYQNLYTSDNRICYQALHSTSTGSGFLYAARIIDENGQIIKDFGSGSSAALYVEQTQDGAKLLLYKNNKTEVYSLPGTFDAIADEQSGLPNEITLANSYPNPANGAITINYELPKSVDAGELLVYNVKGELIKSYKVDHTFSNLCIPTTEWTTGVYFYNIKTHEGLSESKKLVIAK